MHTNTYLDEKIILKNRCRVFLVFSVVCFEVLWVQKSGVWKSAYLLYFCWCIVLYNSSELTELNQIWYFDHN